MVTTLLFSIVAAPPIQLKGVVTDGGRPVKDAVVWLRGLGDPRPIKATVLQKNKTFVPRITVAPVGSTIDFPNMDDIFHNVFAEYQAKKFDLGMYPRGQTRKVTFDKPGVISVLCNMHSEMSAFVVIVDTPHYTKTDGKGQFTLSGVPEGAYDLEAWHESGKKASLKVQSGTTVLKVAIGRS